MGSRLRGLRRDGEETAEWDRSSNAREQREACCAVWDSLDVSTWPMAVGVLRVMSEQIAKRRGRTGVVASCRLWRIKRF